MNSKQIKFTTQGFMAENTRIIGIKERVHQSQWSYKQLFMIASSLILIFTNFQTDLPKQRDLNPKRD